MNELVWSEEFSVGVPEIDDQHKTLFELVNRLFHAAIKREDQRLTIEVLDALVEYTRTHFSLEERLLEESGFSGLPGHREDHRRFIEQVFDITRKFQVDDRSVTFELLSFLRNWLQNHIRHSDMEYAAHLARSGYAMEVWAADARRKAGDSTLQARRWWKFWGDSKTP